MLGLLSLPGWSAKSSTEIAHLPRPAVEVASHRPPISTLTGMSDSQRLSRLISIWWRAVGDITRLLDELPATQWSTPTDLPGWNVHAVAAHVAHVESVLAGDSHVALDVGEPAHVRNAFGRYMEQGVVARRRRSPGEVIEEIRSATGRRHAALVSAPPTDGSARPDRLPPGLDWDLVTLLRNRPIDIWMHEQDIRRAVGLPGNMDSAPADHAIESLTHALAFVVAKRAGAPAGTTARFEVGDRTVGVLVDDQGRGRLAEPTATPGIRPEVPPDVCIDMPRESFVVAAGGRRIVAADPAGAGGVQVSGDRELAARILRHMAVTM
jgi:uncharacterized protein (TIGR03083 family)